MSILGSAWDNLIGGFKDTADTVKDFQWQYPQSAVNMDYNLYMTLTLKTWQAVHPQLIEILEKLLSEGKISKTQFNNIITRRNALYAAAKLKPPTVALKQVAPPVTPKEVVTTVTKDIASAVKDVGKSVADTGVGAAGATVNTVAGLNVGYLVLGLVALLFVRILQK